MYWKYLLFGGCCLLLTLVCLNATGCGQVEDTHYNVLYDPCQPLVVEPHPDLGDDELAAVERAVAMWNEAAALELTLAGDHRAAPFIPVSFEQGAPMMHGYYDDESGQVIINRNLSGQKSRAIVLAHELGHAFGLDHVDADTRRSLMNAGNLDTEVTDGDVQALYETWDDCAE